MFSATGDGSVFTIAVNPALIQKLIDNPDTSSIGLVAKIETIDNNGYLSASDTTPSDPSRVDNYGPTTGGDASSTAINGSRPTLTVVLDYR